MSYDLVTGDTGSKLRVTCKDNDTGLPINLTGATVNLQWKQQNSAGTFVSMAMTIVDAVNGIAEYQFLSTDIEPPSMNFQIKITDGSGKITKSLDLLALSVRRALI
jgi:hypothetical protein